jgi:Predicted metal-dependent protease of the PAD1/JAB1 superfamily
MKIETEQAIREHAIAEYPREACGFIAVVKGKERYLPCRNVADNPTETFIVHHEDQMMAEDIGDIIGFAHSHPDGSPDMSEADRVMCSRDEIPWYILSVNAQGDTTDLQRYEPDGYEAPLVGRQFSHGVLDCYTLIRDYYSRELNIVLPDFERQDDWWNKDQDLYMEHFRDAGFEPITGAISKHDVILMQVRSPKVNHGAVFIGGPDHILHHMHGRLSTREVYGGWYQEITRIIIRHRELQA